MKFSMNGKSDHRPKLNPYQDQKKTKPSIRRRKEQRLNNKLSFATDKPQTSSTYVSVVFKIIFGYGFGFLFKFFHW